MAQDKTFVCQVCGKETVAVKRGHGQKYCADCRAGVKREQDRKRWLRQKGKNRKDRIETRDTPEMMELCLSCKRLGCSHGECDAVKNLAKKRKAKSTRYAMVFLDEEDENGKE